MRKLVRTWVPVSRGYNRWIRRITQLVTLPLFPFFTKSWRHKPTTKYYFHDTLCIQNMLKMRVFMSTDVMIACAINGFYPYGGLSPHRLISHENFQITTQQNSTYRITCKYLSIWRVRFGWTCRKWRGGDQAVSLTASKLAKRRQSQIPLIETNKRLL